MVITNKLEIFCQVLAETDDQSKAYRAMLPNSLAKPESIWTRASNIAKDVKVKSRVAELKLMIREKAENDFNITQDRVLLEIARLAFNDPRKTFNDDGNLLPVVEWPSEVAAAISSIKIIETRSDEDNVTTKLKEIKFWDKGRQIELAAKTLGMLVDKKEVVISNPANELTKLKEMAKNAVKRS